MQSTALSREEKRDPVPSVASHLSSAASAIVLADDPCNSFHTPNLLVSFATRSWFNFNPQQWSLSPPLLVNFAPSRGQVQPPFPGQFPPPSLSPSRLGTSRSPEQGQPLSALTSRAPRSLLPASVLWVSVQQPRPRSPRLPSRIPPPSVGTGPPPSPEQLKVSVTSEGSAGGGERAGEAAGEGGGEALMSLPGGW